LDSLYGNFGKGCPEEFVTTAEKTLRTCRQLGYLYLDRVVNAARSTITVPEWEKFELSDLVEWDAGLGRWRIRSHEPPIDDVLVQLTQGAVQDLAHYGAQQLGRRA
jgi:hypothetical protein